MEGQRQAFSLGKATGATVTQLPIRRLPSWIDAFYDYTEHLPSPPLFRKWAAIGLIAGALERKVHIRTFGSSLYPNTYLILVAPAGVGKTVLTSEIYNFWAELTEHHIASSSVTGAALIDELTQAERRIIRPGGQFLSFNSLKICSNELGSLLPTWENSFMSILTDIYDGHPYSERRRTKDRYTQMKAPQLNMIAATTPSYLNGLLPEGAWEHGFMSRVILIYSGEMQLRDPFAVLTGNEPLKADLIHDLKVIAEMTGKMTFAEDAAQAITNWHMKKGPPQPDHPRLMHYSTRRTAHLLKLCMIASAATSNELVITLDNVHTALDWLIEAETYMPDIFKSMQVGGDARAIEETWHFTYQIWMKEGKTPIAEHRIVNFLQERTPAHNVGRILEVMVRAKILNEKLEPKLGKAYEPRPRRL